MSYTQQNKAWCLNQKWRAARWETLKYAFGESSLVRYVDEPPLADMEGICEFLLHADSCAALKVNEKLVHGAFVPAAAWWETVVLRGQERVRLYQECVPAAAEAGGTAYVTENGCTFAVTVTPYFRQAAVSAPAAGTSGVSYRILGDRADPRTGLWMFMLERREQKTTTTGAVKVRDDALATAWEQTFYGVRTGNKDHTGAAVAGLWEAGSGPAGTLVEVAAVRKNENCTTDVTQRKTVLKELVTASGTDRDAFRTVTVTESVGKAALGAPAAAVGGLSVSQRDVAGAEGFYERRREAAQETPLAGAVEDVKSDAFETVTETLDRSQAAPYSAEGETLERGETLDVRHERTKGMWWDTLKRRTKAVFVAQAQVRTSRSAFETVTETQSAAAQEKIADAPAATGGAWHERLWKYRRDRAYDNVDTLHQEHDVALASKVTDETVLELTVEQESVDAAPLGTPPEPDPGSAVTYKDDLTPGGKWRRRLTSVLEKAYALTYEAGRSVFETVAGETGVAGGVTLAAGPGQSVTASASLTQRGLLRYNKQTVTEANVAKTFASESDYFHTEQSETGVADAVALAPGAGQSAAAGASITPGGKLKYTKQTQTAKAAQVWTLVDKTQLTPPLSILEGAVYDHIKVVLYSNCELATARAAAEAFIGAHHGFTMFKNNTNYAFYYDHDIGFALHVNRWGKWDGTLTLRAVLKDGMITTTTA